MPLTPATELLDWYTDWPLYYKSLISIVIAATEVILQNMEIETEMGLKCREMLYRGEAIPEEMVAKMLEDKINSAEVCYTGSCCLRIIISFYKLIYIILLILM